jgi:hypothetical protein
MLSKKDAALEEIASLDARIPPGGPPWLTQARQLWGADILCLCGERTAAVIQAQEAIGMPPTLYAPSFAGPFARWLALTSEEGSRAKFLSILSDLSGRLSELDSLDRVEILLARQLLGESRSVEVEDILRQNLARLPPAVAIQLRRLGAVQS